MDLALFDVNEINKETYNMHNNLVIRLGLKTPTAIGPKQASDQLQEKIPILQVVKPGFTINDCLYNDYTEFKDTAKSLGMRIYNAPLGVMHLTRTLPDRLIGVGDGNFVRTPKVTYKYLDSVSGKITTRKLNEINNRADINELVYEVLTRYWNGTNLESAVDLIFKQANTKLEKEVIIDLHTELNKILYYSKLVGGGLRTLENYYYAISNCPDPEQRLAEIFELNEDDVKLHPIPMSNFDNILSAYGKEKLNEISEYWDYLPRGIRSLCKTDHIRQILINKLAPLEDSDYIQSAILLYSTKLFNRQEFTEREKGNINVKLEKLKSVSEKIQEFKQDMYNTPIADKLKDIVDNSGSIIESLELIEEELEKFGNLLHIVNTKGSRRMSTIEKGFKSVEGREFINELETLRDIIINAQKSGPGIGVANQLTLQMYANMGYIYLEDYHANRYPPESAEKELHINQSNLAELKIFKGHNFNLVKGFSEICPLGLVDKWHTWKFIHDPIISSAAKYYFNNDQKARVEFDTAGKFEFASESNDLIMTYDEAEEFCQKVENLYGDLISQNKRKWYSKKIKKRGENLLVYTNPSKESNIKDVYYTIRSYLNSRQKTH